MTTKSIPTDLASKQLKDTVRATKDSLMVAITFLELAEVSASMHQPGFARDIATLKARVGNFLIDFEGHNTAILKGGDL